MKLCSGDIKLAMTVARMPAKEVLLCGIAYASYVQKTKPIDDDIESEQ